jgi:hypothetical protein
MTSHVPVTNSKYNWLMSGKTIDNINEALSPSSDITTANVTYIREDYTLPVGPHYTEDNVIPIVDAEYGYSLHTITVPTNGTVLEHSEVIYVDTVSGVLRSPRIVFPANTIVKSTGCVFDSNTSTAYRVLAIATEKVDVDGSVEAVLHFYKIQDFSLLSTKKLDASLLSGVGEGSTLHFSTQLIPVDSNKIPCLKKSGFSDESKSNIPSVKKALLVGVSPAQKWDLDMRNTKNNDITLKVGINVRVPVSMNDVVYTDKQELKSTATYAGLRWSVDQYKQGTSQEASKGVYTKYKSFPAIESNTTLYKYIKSAGLVTNECGHLLCLDITVNDPVVLVPTDPQYPNIGDRIWSIRTAPESSSETEPEDPDCLCEDEPANTQIDSTYLLSNKIYNNADELTTQTHVLITNVMTTGDSVIGFNNEGKNANECRIYPGDLRKLDEVNATNDSTYVAWIRSFVNADTNITHSNENSNISFFSPIVAHTSGNEGRFVTAQGTGSIDGVEIVDQTVITYDRDDDGNYKYSNTDSSDVIVFARLSDVLPEWSATKMNGQGAGRINAVLADPSLNRLNSPFNLNFTLKGDVTVESSLTYTAGSTARRVKITDKFSKGLFVFCYVSQNDTLSKTELDSLNFRGAGVTGMPVIDMDDGSVKFGTGKFNQIPMDQIFLENCEKLRMIDIDDAELPYSCFDASNYCKYDTAGTISASKTQSTLCNIDNLNLNKQYNLNRLINVFGNDEESVYKVNIAAVSERGASFYYNSICSSKLYQKGASYNPDTTESPAVEETPSSGYGIRIWDTITPGTYLSFALDSDITVGGDSDLDNKRIPVVSIEGRVALTYPQYHEITSGAHIHYNIANQCSSTNKPTNYVSVFTKGGCVGFYESADLSKPKAIFMCAVPLCDTLETGKTGSIGGVKFGTVADQFFIYALCPNIAGLTLAMNSTPSTSISNASIASISASGGSQDGGVMKFTESYIIAYDLNAISAPPAVPIAQSIPVTNIYNGLTSPYIVAYLADTGKKYLAGTLTAANNLLIVPTGGYSTSSVVRLYRKTDIAHSANTAEIPIYSLNSLQGQIWAPHYDLLPAYQIVFSARSVTGVVVSGNSLFIQGGISPSTKADFNNSITTTNLSSHLRTYTLDF